METIHDAKKGLAVNLNVKIVLLLLKQSYRTYNPLLTSFTFLLLPKNTYIVQCI